MKEGKTPPPEEPADPLRPPIDAALADTPALAEKRDRACETPAPVGSEQAPRSRAAPGVRGRIDLAELTRFAATGGSREPPRERKAKAGAQSGKEENSGVIDLRAIVASAGTGSAPESPSRPAFGSVPAAMPDAGGRQQPGKPRVAAWLALTGLLAASAALGGVFFGMAHVSRHDTGSVAGMKSFDPTNGRAAPATTRAAPAEDHAKTAISSASSGVPPEGSTPRAELPPPPAGSSTSGSPLAPGATPTAGRAASARAAMPARAPSNSPDGEADLNALMEQAVGNRRVAAGGSSARLSETPATQGVPLKPAFGAVQGAVGTALPAARACLGPDDPIARATMTFRSDGSVENVAVAGDAVGKPAEACIQRALLAARLPAFAAPSFTWTTTVRPQ